MRRYSVYMCDVCGKHEQSDGYPKDWIQVEIRLGSYFNDDNTEQLLDKDCCSQDCVKAVLKEYING